MLETLLLLVSRNCVICARFSLLPRETFSMTTLLLPYRYVSPLKLLISFKKFSRLFLFIYATYYRQINHINDTKLLVEIMWPMNYDYQVFNVYIIYSLHSVPNSNVFDNAIQILVIEVTAFSIE